MEFVRMFDNLNLYNNQALINNMTKTLRYTEL